jgi:hypothetical protein
MQRNQSRIEILVLAWPMAGSRAEMKQLGFALAFGVLLKTFHVRPILAPAFLILLGRRQLTNPPARSDVTAPVRLPLPYLELNRGSRSASLSRLSLS